MESTLPCPAAPPDVSESAASYEAEHVQAVYNTIAPHFAATRYAPWPRVNAFLSGLPKHGLVADVGCGNGKYLLVASTSGNNIFSIGTDLCEPLVRIAARRETNSLPEDVSGARECFDAGVADVRRLPFRDGAFDAAVNIAVVHHLSTLERRVEAWQETLRIVRKGGRVLACVWALERPSVPKPKRGNHGAKMLTRRFETQDVFVPWHMRRRKAGADNDKILGDPEEVLHRFYHVYKKGELEQELSKVSSARVIESYYDHQNWCAVIERI